jgi:hypothetical protein
MPLDAPSLRVHPNLGLVQSECQHSQTETIYFVSNALVRERLISIEAILEIHPTAGFPLHVETIICQIARSGQASPTSVTSAGADITVWSRNVDLICNKSSQKNTMVKGNTLQPEVTRQTFRCRLSDYSQNTRVGRESLHPSVPN